MLGCEKFLDSSIWSIKAGSLKNQYHLKKERGMSNIKCGACGLYNFAGVTECRRCNQGIGYQSQVQSISNMPAPSTAANPAPYGATSAAAVFSAPMPWTPVKSYEVDDLEGRRPNHRPVLSLTFFLLAIMLVCAGIPPKLENIQTVILTLHISLFLFTLFGLGKWLVTRIQTAEEPNYSGEIEGFLNLPATGMIVYCMMTVWMSVECRSVLGKIEETLKSFKNRDFRQMVYSGGFAQTEQLNKAKDFFEFAAPCLFFIAILFVIALIFFYRRQKRAPLVCIVTLVLQILGFLLIANRGQKLQEAALSSVQEKSLPATSLSAFDFLLFVGVLCMLFNFVAFILYFLISRRVKATFV
jgi:hypothetical protein